jgi:hypothetical protein
MKARAREKEMNKRRAAREFVTICSCPGFDAYLSAKKWPIAEQESKAMFTRLDKEMRARFGRDLRHHVLSPLAIVAPRHVRVNLPPVLNHVVKRTRHALDFRLKKMVAKVSSRRRLLGESKKEKVANLMKDAAIRFFVSKQYLPHFLIPTSIQNDDVDFSHRVAKAHVEGVNPLFDGVDWTILLGWDDIHPICFCLQFIALDYVGKPLPGLKKWGDAGAALFIAFVTKDESFYSQAPVPTAQHRSWRNAHPNWRPYQRYAGRRKNLDLHPHKRRLIANAVWDQHRDVFHVASEADGWGWEIHRFNPHAHR